MIERSTEVPMSEYYSKLKFRKQGTEPKFNYLKKVLSLKPFLDLCGNR